MKIINIQIQQDHRSKAMARLVNDLISLPEIKTIQIHKGPINQKYVNIGIPVRSVRNAWKVLGPKIKSDRVLSRNSVVVCEGKHGWDDYELIYHWDADAIDQKWRTV